MIEAEIFYQDRVIKGFIIKGHAGMAEKGRDIVCASVSVLGQTALLGLNAYLSQQPQWKIDEEGYLECWLPESITRTELDTAQIILHTMELGLLSIEESYEQYLKVIKRRWNRCCSK
jgi:uncharacterized protein YsxB (DUF464 family)